MMYALRKNLNAKFYYHEIVAINFKKCQANLWTSLKTKKKNQKPKNKYIHNKPRKIFQISWRFLLKFHKNNEKEKYWRAIKIGKMRCTWYSFLLIHVSEHRRTRRTRVTVDTVMSTRRLEHTHITREEESNRRIRVEAHPSMIDTLRMPIPPRTARIKSPFQGRLEIPVRIVVLVTMWWDMFIVSACFRVWAGWGWESGIRARFLHHLAADCGNVLGIKLSTIPFPSLL